MADLTPFFLDEEAERLASLTDEELLKELEDSPEFLGYLASTCGPEYREQAKWYDDPIFQPFREWTWRIEDAVRQKRPDAMRYWCPKLVRALSHMSHMEFSRNRRKDMEQEREEYLERERKELLESFLKSVPATYRDAELSDFGSDKQKALVKRILDGASLLVYGGNGVGKSHLAWSLAKHWKREGKRSVYIMKLAYLNSFLANLSMTSGRSGVEIIERYYVKTLEVMIIDEVDKAQKGDVAFRNLEYMVDRRYEEQKQTILFCNASSEEELTAKLGPSLVSRFYAKSWNASIVDFGTADKRGEY